VANINDVLEGHVVLEIESVDRLLLNAYVAALQVPGQGRAVLVQPPWLSDSRAGFARADQQSLSCSDRRFAGERRIPVLRLHARGDVDEVLRGAG